MSAEKRTSAEIFGQGRKGNSTGITIGSEYSPEQPSIKIMIRKGRKDHKSWIQSPCTKSLLGVQVSAERSSALIKDKPIAQQDALPRSEFQPRLLPGQDPLSLKRHPLCHPVQADC
ncbi:hypothetical protein V6N11_001531 [Hibiscus sabdariffa]|uniref:Uncharacterized protein n=1 Tax=Hibiscus sabdariffa TaxID=183260 RepID=A0ABR2S0D9_9ROSI